ncbi:5-methylcytosine restriction system specificity protein McrC [Paenibacillus polymyxa]|uniref:5-methylcytosine restriction system specificity protein McrC n=1 Tax=Paenibacillus polymyxa TaxID=1406 RepID=UPI000737AEC0|nr:hypothetical protein [Paenibacillus polymyxa]
MRDTRKRFHLVLEEYDKNPKLLEFISEVEAEKKLAEINTSMVEWKNKLGLSSLPIEISKINKRFIQFYAKGVTGFISIGNLSIEIKPKFLESTDNGDEWRAALTKALIITNQQNMFDKSFTSSKQSGYYLSDLMAETFLISLREGIENGLPKSYEEERELTQHFKGKYDTRRCINFFTQPHLIPCVFDEYTEDYLINQLLRWAALELSKSVASVSLSNQLVELANQISASNLIHFDVTRVNNLYLSPQYSYLDEALYISKLLIINKSLEHGDGKNRLRGFLWNSAVVFEELMKQVVKRICKANQYTFTDKSVTFIDLVEQNGALPQKPQLKTSPDIRVMVGNKTKFLLDVKYKVWRKQPKNEDIYQVIAGARVVECPVVSLLYPSTKRNDKLLIYNIRGKGYPLVLGTIFADISLLAHKKGFEQLVKSVEQSINELSDCYYAR